MAATFLGSRIAFAASATADFAPAFANRADGDLTALLGEPLATAPDRAVLFAAVIGLVAGAARALFGLARGRATASVALGSWVAVLVAMAAKPHVRVAGSATRSFMVDAPTDLPVRLLRFIEG